MNFAETEITIEVPFYDLDPMQVVWHGNYIKYTEIARCALLKKIGYGYPEMGKDGYIFPVAKMDLKFIKPATFGQKLSVKIIMTEYEPALKFKYIITDTQTGEVIFKANSMQICVDTKTNTSIYEAPKRLKEGLNV